MVAQQMGERKVPVRQVARRGPLRLVRLTWESPAPPVRAVEEEIARLLRTAARVNERELLRATRDTSPR